MRNWFLPFLAFLLSGPWGCNNELSKRSEIDELRILAIQADKPQVNINTVINWAEESVTFDALVVNPNATSITYTWEFCGVESSTACNNIEDTLPPFDDSFAALSLGCNLLLENTDAPNPSQAEAMTEIRWQQLTESIRSLYRNKSSGVAQIDASTPFGIRYNIPKFEVSLFKDLAMFHCITNLTTVTAGWWPSVILTVSDDTATIVSQKRLTLAISDLGGDTKKFFFEKAFGLPLCDESPTTENCVNYSSDSSRNSTNTNPAFLSIQKTNDEKADGEFCNIAGSVQDNPCDTNLPLTATKSKGFRIRPVFAEDSFQPYQILETDIDFQQLTVEDRQEEISVSWFVSAGTVEDELTWPLFTKTLDTVFLAPDASPNSNQRIWLWMVARDQRGGTSWYELPIAYQE